MKKFLFALALFLIAPQAYAAASFDATSAQNASATSWSDWNTTGTWTATIAAGTTALICGIETQTGAGGSGDVMTSLTAGGTNMIQYQKRQRSDTNQVFTYTYALMNPPTGSVSMVATVSTHSQFNYASCNSYTGVGAIEATSTSNEVDCSSSPCTGTVTTGVDNAWLVGLAFNSGGQTISASTNTTFRGSILNWGRMADTNAAQTPAGSYSMAFTGTITSPATFQILVLDPIIATAALDITGMIRSLWIQ